MDGEFRERLSPGPPIWFWTRCDSGELFAVSLRNPLGALRHTRAPCELGPHSLLERIDDITVAPDV